MKKIVAFFACCILTAGAFAQSPNLKIGYINSATLLSTMPEKAKADTDIAKYARSFQEQIDLMMKEYQAKGKQYQANEKKMTDVVKEVKMKELQDLQNRVEAIQQSAQEKMQKKKSELWEPIVEKVNKTVKAIAIEKNYDFIFDATNGAMLYEKEEYDITSQVKAKMGVK